MSVKTTLNMETTFSIETLIPLNHVRQWHVLENYNLFWHSEERASWYILILKANEMHYFSNLFDKVLYMFQTDPLSIIRSISTLYTRNRYRGADKFLARPDWKNNWKVTIFRPTWRSLLPRRPRWKDNILTFFFLSGLQNLRVWAL